MKIIMKKPVVLKRKSTSHAGGANYAYLLFSALFAAGIIFGCSTVKWADSDVIDAIGNILTTVVRTDIKNGFLKCLISSAVVSVIFPFLSLLCGLCAFGAPLSMFLPFAFGGVCGIASASYYYSYGMKGLGFCTLVMFPFFAIIAATVIRCCNESLTMSMELFGFLTVNGKNKSGKPALKEFCAKYAVLSLPLLAAALLRAIGFLLFAEMFDFI